MFYGTYEHVLDNKNRLMMPVKLRLLLGDKIYLMKGFDGCVSVFDSASYEKMVTKLEELSFNKSKSRAYVRTILSSTVEIEIDNLGRITLPTYIVNKYEISKELTVIGAGDHIEIWNRNKWIEYSTNNEENFDIEAEEI
ncbi:MAG: division/cell wall cluster transcriptional repressor MraZ [Bacilli bacterium]